MPSKGGGRRWRAGLSLGSYGRGSVPPVPIPEEVIDQAFGAALPGYIEHVPGILASEAANMEMKNPSSM